MSMSKTLAEERAGWEPDAAWNRRVSHFAVRPNEVYMSVVAKGVENHMGGRDEYFRLIRYFRLGDGWETSVDINDESLETVVRRMGELIGGMTR